MADQEKEILEQECCEADQECAADSAEAKETACEGTCEQDCEETAECEEAEETCEEEEETEQDGEASEDAPKTWAEKKAAKKQAKLDKKADVYKEKIAELEDKTKRQLAEFENYRRRTEKEKQAMFETGAKSVIEKILPVIDNFERGFATVDPADAEDAFVKGMSQVHRQMLDELERIGVKPIEAIGKEFDPNFHNAVMQVQSDEYEAGVVAQEFQKGYTYRDSVVRYSMVAVVSE